LSCLRRAGLPPGRCPPRPPRRSRIYHIANLSLGVSSTSKTVIWSAHAPASCGAGHPRRTSVPLSPCPHKLDCPTQQAGALPHRHQAGSVAHRRAVPRAEGRRRVFDHPVGSGPPNRTRTHTRSAIASGAPPCLKRLLEYPVDVDRDAIRDGRRPHRFSTLLDHSDAGLPFKGRQVPVGWPISRPPSVEIVGCSTWERLRIFSGVALGHSPSLLQLLRETSESGGKPLFSGAPQHGSDGRKHLAEFIVQFPRDGYADSLPAPR